VGEVERLVGHDPGLLDAKGGRNRTPLVYAFWRGHVGVVRWLVDKGASVNERGGEGSTALLLGKSNPRGPRLPGATSRSCACLLSHSSGKATTDRRDSDGRTALWWACN
jgi:ankyrin repeat protein